MEATIQKQLSSERYTISRKPFYNWLSRNLPQFKEFNALEIDSADFELWESIYKNFIQSNITISSPVQKNLNKIEARLPGYRINYQEQHSYKLTFSYDSMDFVISNNNNFVQNQESIKEVKRILKNKGLFINIINGDRHIEEFKTLFNIGLGRRNISPMNHKVKYKYNQLKKVFKNVSYREYSRILKVEDPNSVLGYYLSNRNPKVREWALEESNWILEEAKNIVDKYGFFTVNVNLGMLVCKQN